jgi:hypothetical protein
MGRAANLTLATLLILVLAASAPLARAQPILSSAAAGSSPASVETGLAIATDPHITAMLAQVDPGVLYQTVGDLSGEWPAMVGGQPYTIITRHTASGEPLVKATQYAGERLEALGLEVEYHTWRDGTPPNVIGELRAPDGAAGAEQSLIICGHLDDLPSTGLAPGADDNASGSAGVLAAAAILSQYAWTCDLRFALWTGEEQGLLGSRTYAARARSRGEEILAIVNLDMIAYNSDTLPVIDLHADSSLPETVALAGLFDTVVDAYGVELQPDILVNDSLRWYSDSWSFVEQGYAGILAIEDHDDFNRYYHTSSDRLATLDMAYYSEVVRAAIGTMAHAGCFPLGGLAGRVRDASTGAGIAGAAVTLADPLGITYAAGSDAAGAFALEAMAGLYTATVTAPGFLPIAVRGTVVPTGTVATLDLVLAPIGPLPWQIYLPVVSR